MTEILFSFVIPVHNRAHTICYCLDSILCQADVCAYEIIIVDDASEDKTTSIIKRIADITSNQRLLDLDFSNALPETLKLFSQIGIKDEFKIRSRIKTVFLSSNVGAAATRNIGIEKAKGKYIWFVDSDDFIARNALSILKEIVSAEDFEILKFARHSYYSNLPPKSYIISDVKDIVQWKYINNIKSLLFVLGNGAVWCAIFNREFIGANRFNTNYAYSEDSVFTWQVTLNAKRIAYLDHPLYGYMCTPGSLTSTKPLIRFECYIKAIKEYLLAIQLSVKSEWEKRMLVKECEKRLYFHAFYTYDFQEITPEMWNIWYAIYEDVMINNLMRPKIRRFISKLIYKVRSIRLVRFIFNILSKYNCTLII